jgi:hypothetical protein
MRAANILVFDENIQVNAGSPTPFYTDQSLNDRLGVFDMLAIMAVVDDVPSTGTGATLDVYLEHSADGRNWQSKFWTGSPPAANPIITVTSTSSGQNAYVGNDPGTTPSLAFVRFRLELTPAGANPASAHVRLFVTGRNWGR